ncbi:hypothetical protein L0P75_16190, partial [Faecalibacillus intestinalis]|uniref:hypothetical protein n=1 Tax=Faecalibacillus intestinalis TaxID=1982626 RepID=UPI001EDF9A69
RNFESKVFEGVVSLKQNNQQLVNKEIYIQENKQLRFSGSHKTIKMVYITPYDHFRENSLNATIEIIKDGDKDKIIE